MPSCLSDAMGGTTDQNLMERVRQELSGSGKTVKELAQELGFGTSAVYAWLACQCAPGAEALRRMHIRGYDIMYMITGERRKEHIREV